MNIGEIPTNYRSEHLDHIAVWSANWKDSAKVLSDFLGWDIHPLQFSASGESVGDMDLVFINANGVWIELVQPTSKGPGMDLLETLGDGAVVELDFQCSNYQFSLDEALEHNLQMIGMDGLPLKDRGKIIDGVIDPNAEGPPPEEYLAYYPFDLSGGTAVEIYERIDTDKESILNKRDKIFGLDRYNQPINQKKPKTRYLTILVDDIDKVCDFYKKHILLNVSQSIDWEGHKLSVIDAKGVFEESISLRIIQPVADDSIMQIYKSKGSGHIMDIGIEVDNLNDFIENIQSPHEKIKIVDYARTNQDLENPFKKDDVMQENYFYFPLELSRGMNIKVFEKNA